MRRDTVYVPPPRDENFGISSDEERSTSSSQLELDLNAARLPSDDEEDSDAPVTRREKIISYAKQILPHVGLVLLLLIYLLVGASIFQRIEGPNEIITKNNEIATILGLRDQFQESIWNLTHNPDTVISRETFNGLGQEYFERLVTEIFNAYKNQFITNMHLLNVTSADEHLWTYPNSVLFATTVITTIGSYGHLVPITPTGRVFCIGFALVGIPLLLVTIADIGQFLSEFLNYLHQAIRSFEQKVRKQSRRISHFRRDRTQSQSGRSDAESSGEKAGSINLNDITEEEIEEEPNTKQPLRIPILMVLVVILSYTALGGLLFQKVEGWSYMEAFYFCFISMATIGFGDYVPTKQMYIFLTMLYIIFGLSLRYSLHSKNPLCWHKNGRCKRRSDDWIATLRTSIEIIKTAGGKIYKVRGAMLSKTQARELDYLLRSSQYQQKNILYEPLPPAVQRLVREKNIKILPDDISEHEGFIVRNRDYEKPATKRFLLQQQRSPNTIHRYIRMANKLESPPALMPFVLKESDI
ncbi:TWiK family of potassium channels protein 7 [Aphelenchoides bicaudatus]|nr:TWiK family of potassium channels protein 7 [Aphelenchoides bicaudatus]